MDRIGLVTRLTAAFGEEIDRRDPGAAIPWPNLPDVRSMVAHVGGIHRWVTEILRTRGPVRQDTTAPAPKTYPRPWYEEGRAGLIEALVAVPPDAPCWIIGDRAGTAAFWRRRMVYENVKHLIDLRASGGGEPEPADELAPEDYADGIDELFTEFLPRTRPTLPRLPVPVVLQATDTARSWRIDRDWTIGGPGAGSRPTRLLATAGNLALTVWERADPVQSRDRFSWDGADDAIAALQSTSIHPW